MTIAICYVSPEGVVLGADSTSSAIVSPGGFHYFNYNQKLFEIGEDGTLGVLTWGLGGLGGESYRRMFADLADDIKANAPTGLQDIADIMAPAIQMCKALGAKLPFDPTAAPPAPGARTKDEEDRFQELKRGLVVGFCIAGYVLPSRDPEAFEVIFDPLGTAQPVPTRIQVNNHKFWGAPKIIQRLIFGIDDEMKASILSSAQWTGSQGDLDNIVKNHTLSHPIVPIRDAIDFVHSCIYSTIKALKFSNLSQICGGPIELAVVTTDRRFRWVRHKEWDVAITDGGI
jgi:hypothetical protein